MHITEKEFSDLVEEIANELGVVLPEKGLLAGQSVEQMHRWLREGCRPKAKEIADLDVFVESSNQSGWGIYAKGEDLPVPAMVDYHGWLGQDPDAVAYRVVTATRIGRLNLIEVTETDPVKILEGFDINAIQVGFDLEAGKFVATPAYEEFLETGEIKVTNLYTPQRTLVRLADKVRRFGFACDFEREAELVTAALADRDYFWTGPMYALWRRNRKRLKPWLKVDEKARNGFFFVKAKKKAVDPARNRYVRFFGETGVRANPFAPSAEKFRACEAAWDADERRTVLEAGRVYAQNGQTLCRLMPASALTPSLPRYADTVSRLLRLLLFADSLFREDCDFVSNHLEGRLAGEATLEAVAEELSNGPRRWGDEGPETKLYVQAILDNDEDALSVAMQKARRVVELVDEAADEGSDDARPVFYVPFENTFVLGVDKEDGGYVARRFCIGSKEITRIPLHKMMGVHRLRPYDPCGPDAFEKAYIRRLLAMEKTKEETKVSSRSPEIDIDEDDIPF